MSQVRSLLPQAVKDIILGRNYLTRGPRGGGGGGKGRGATQQSCIQGSAAPRSNPLPFYIPFSTGKEPLSYTFHLQKVSTPFTCPV